MIKSFLRSSHRKLVSTLAVLAFVFGVVAFAGPANAAYAPSGTLSNYNPRRCTSISLTVRNFHKKSNVIATTTNKGGYVRLTVVKTDANGYGKSTFRVPCTLTPGYHIIGLANGSYHPYIAFNVRKFRG